MANDTDTGRTVLLYEENADFVNGSRSKPIFRIQYGVDILFPLFFIFGAIYFFPMAQQEREDYFNRQREGIISTAEIVHAEYQAMGIFSKIFKDQAVSFAFTVDDVVYEFEQAIPLEVYENFALTGFAEVRYHAQNPSNVALVGHDSEPRGNLIRMWLGIFLGFWSLVWVIVKTVRHVALIRRGQIIQGLVVDVRTSLLNQGLEVFTYTFQIPETGELKTSTYDSDGSTVRQVRQMESGTQILILYLNKGNHRIL